MHVARLARVVGEGGRASSASPLLDASIFEILRVMLLLIEALKWEGQSRTESYGRGWKAYGGLKRKGFQRETGSRIRACRT